MEVEEKTSTGLKPNFAGLLCYVLGWITGLVFLLVEKESQFVRFHAMQSVVTFGALTIASIVLGFIPLIGWVVDSLLPFLGLALWIILMVKAYQGEQYKLPWAGDFAEEQLS